MSKNMQGFGMMIQKLKASPKKIVFTEGTDERILEATSRLLASSFLTPILVGKEDEVQSCSTMICEASSIKYITVIHDNDSNKIGLY